MRQFKLIKLTLLIVALSAITTSAAGAERLHESRADFLRLDSNRIYVWVENPIKINTDFSIAIRCDGVGIYRSKVAGVLDRVAVSSNLPSEMVATLQSRKDCAFAVFLESDIICDSLIIAMPANLRNLWLDTVFIANAEPPIRCLFRYYDDMKEVEIAAKLQRVDLLIMPQFEIPDAAALIDSPSLLEWNLLSATINDDLLATALNDCVRGLLADSSERAYSSLINQAQLETIFPQNWTHARELFTQSRKNKEKFDCYFPGYKMYPRLAEQFNLAMDSCSGRSFTFRDSQSHPLQLSFFDLGSDRDSSSSCVQAVRKMADPIRATLNIEKATALDSCLLGLISPDTCCGTLSRAIAESIT